MSTFPQNFSQNLSFLTDSMFHIHHNAQENDKNHLVFPDLNLNNPSHTSSFQSLFDHADQSPFNKSPQIADLSDSFFENQVWSQADQASSPSNLSPLEEGFNEPQQKHEYDDMIKNFLLSGVSENSRTILKKTFSAESRLSSSSSDPSQKRKRKTWRPEEDKLVIQLVEKHGQRWQEISGVMKNRTNKQIRDRYLNVLMPEIKKSSWTAEEDEIILSLYHKYGPKWRLIAQDLQGRPETRVKNRFHTTLKGIYTKKYLRKRVSDCEEKVSLSPACEESSTCGESPLSSNSFGMNRKAADFVDMMFSFH